MKVWAIFLAWLSILSVSTAQDIILGMSEQEVMVIIGSPTSVLKGGSKKIITWPGGRLILKDGKVIEVTKQTISSQPSGPAVEDTPISQPTDGPIWPEISVDYEYVLLEEVAGYDEPLRKAGGGSINLYYNINSPDEYGLFSYTRASPEHRNNDKRYRGMAPSNGAFVVKENEVTAFVGLIEKAKQWHSAAKVAGVAGVSKELGTFGKYRLWFSLNKAYQPSVNISEVAASTDESTEETRARMSRMVTLLEPCFDIAIDLLKRRGELVSYSKRKAAEKIAKEEKAKDIFK